MNEEKQKLVEKEKEILKKEIEQNRIMMEKQM
jgi:hypothetical protein